MASKIEFVEFIVDQLQEAGLITYKKMFGEYGIYCDGKIFALICNNQFFLKITEAGRQICYFLVEEVEDRELLTRLTAATCAALPEPKPKQKKK